MTQPDTMFERYGGQPFVTRFVLSFYDCVLSSTVERLPRALDERAPPNG